MSHAVGAVPAQGRPASGRRPVVTLSSPYGAGGSVIGPALAQRLGVPFVDRAIPVAVARELNLSVDEALERDDTAPHGIGRVLAAFALVPGGTLGPVEMGSSGSALSAEQFVRQTESTIRAMAASGTGAVFLGRAAAIVLADRPDVLHVRLTGPEQARAAQAALHEGISEQEAQRTLRQTDRARRAYVRTFYRRDPQDSGLYHLVIDGTRFRPDWIVQLLADAAASASQPVSVS